MTFPRSAWTGSPLNQDGLFLVAGGNVATGITLQSGEFYGFARVKTDKADYPPGTTVNITGSGWQPGEIVALTLVESPLIDTHGPYAVTVQPDGTFSDSSFATDIHDVDVHFTLTAAGSVSQAQTTFTDANASDGDGTMAVSPTSVTAGSAGNSFTFTFQAPNNKPFLSGSQMTVQVPAGWTAPQ